jgi:hypothetical protein
LVMQVWERLLLVHLLRCFEQRQWLARLHGRDALTSNQLGGRG